MEEPAATVADAGEQSGGALAQRLAEVAEPEREQVVLELVQAQAAAILGHASAAEVDPERPFKDLGFDSVRAVEFRNRLRQVTGVQLPSTLVFDHPTARATARLILGKVDGVESATPSTAHPRSVGPADEPLAIVGMSCRYPGGVAS
ncbi:acyl carrier protein, partial [Streptomyces sp. JJ38]|uniref:acyl carrier protein n=1 Tax=Streptomyces sp. JJ38 TaxID=2738128 RepID=UPI001C566332